MNGRSAAASGRAARLGRALRQQPRGSSQGDRRIYSMCRIAARSQVLGEGRELWRQSRIHGRRCSGALTLLYAQERRAGGAHDTIVPPRTWRMQSARARLQVLPARPMRPDGSRIGWTVRTDGTASFHARGRGPAPSFPLQMADRPPARHRAGRGGSGGGGAPGFVPGLVPSAAWTTHHAASSFPPTRRWPADAPWPVTTGQSVRRRGTREPRRAPSRPTSADVRAVRVALPAPPREVWRPSHCVGSPGLVQYKYNSNRNNNVCYVRRHVYCVHTGICTSAIYRVMITLPALYGVRCLSYRLPSSVCFAGHSTFSTLPGQALNDLRMCLVRATCIYMDRVVHNLRCLDADINLMVRTPSRVSASQPTR